MFHWVEVHGLESIFICWILACIISVMPPLPKNVGFWRTWLYALTQLLGASLDKVVLSSPYGSKLNNIDSPTFQSNTEIKKNTNNNGDEHVEISSEVKEVK